MVDERYPRSNPGRYGNRDQNGGYGQSDYGDRGSYGRGSDRYQNYGSSDDNRSDYGRERGGHQGQGGDDRYGASGYGDRSYGQNEGGTYGANRSSGDRYQGRFQGQAGQGQGEGRSDYGRPQSYGSRDANQGYGRGQQQGGGQQGYGRQPQGYDYDDRGFFDRAGDEVRSWFGDDEAQRRREFDARFDDQRYGNERSINDDHYTGWRRSQIDALDRDYDEYRRENRTKFESEFGSWRNNRQIQRSSLSKVTEHMEVVGSDGAHVGTVDKVRGDRIVLTKTDTDAGGRHHSIPSSWLQTVDDKVTISKTADDAKGHWRDEERNQALFGDDDKKPGTSGTSETKTSDGPHTLNRSFGGTY